MFQKFSLIMLAAFFIVAGANHFLSPQTYLAMMPGYLPFPNAVNLISGGAEVAGGLGILIPRLRRYAAWGLIALLVAVFPANLNVALHGWQGVTIPSWVLWARLPFQFVLIAWVHYSCLSRRGRDA